MLFNLIFTKSILLFNIHTVCPPSQGICKVEAKRYEVAPAYQYPISLIKLL
jgi:hypothetical protein